MRDTKQYNPPEWLTRALLEARGTVGPSASFRGRCQQAAESALAQRNLVSNEVPDCSSLTLQYGADSAATVIHPHSVEQPYAAECETPEWLANVLADIGGVPGCSQTFRARCLHAVEMAFSAQSDAKDQHAPGYQNKVHLKSIYFDPWPELSESNWLRIIAPFDPIWVDFGQALNDNTDSAQSHCAEDLEISSTTGMAVCRRECGEGRQSEQYFYHAYAYGLAGEIEWHPRHNTVMQGSIALPPQGGQRSARVSNYSLEGLISFKEAYVEVGGIFDETHNIHTTHAWSVIEGLNIADIITADRVVARMATYSVAGNHDTEQTFDITGSYFDNLRIAGHEIDVKIASDELRRLNTYRDFSSAYQQGEVEKWLVCGNLQALRDGQAKGVENQDQVVGKSYWCSAVEGMELPKSARAKSGLEAYGGLICIPKFGVIRLAELIVHKHSRTLTMFRVQMCSSDPSANTVDKSERQHEVSIAQPYPQVPALPAHRCALDVATHVVAGYENSSEAFQPSDQG